MVGYDAPYVPGYDCHGLPIELKVDRELGPKKRDMSTADFRRACRAYAERFIGVMTEEFQRLSVVVGKEAGYSALRQVELPRLQAALEALADKTVLRLSAADRLLYESHAAHAKEMSPAAQQQSARYDMQRQQADRLNRWMSFHATALNDGVPEAQAALLAFISSLGLGSTPHVPAGQPITMPNGNCIQVASASVRVAGRSLCTGAATERWILDAHNSIRSRAELGLCLTDQGGGKSVALQPCDLANDLQVWEVDAAIAHLRALAFADPWFIEEPTSPDDVEGHRQIREAVAPLRVATGEMCQNRIVFKQFIMRGAIDVVQIDACRLGGVNEVLAVLLMAAKYDLPVCPHAGGVGLCEYVQHLAMIDYLCFAGTMDGRVIEYVDHLHEHFVDPCVVQDGAYRAPTLPGFSIEMKASSLATFAYRKGAGVLAANAGAKVELSSRNGIDVAEEAARETGKRFGVFACTTSSSQGRERSSTCLYR